MNKSQQENEQTTTQKRFAKSCEAFVYTLYKNYFSLYQQFKEFTYQAKKHNQYIEYYESLKKLCEGKKQLITDINKLLHNDARFEFEELPTPDSTQDL